MADVEKSFADNGDGAGFADLESFVRLDMKGKLRSCPTKNSFSYFAPLQLCGYLDYNNSWRISCRVLETNVNVAIRFARCAASGCFVAVRFDDVA
jgi:hypothetical protein